MHTGFIISRRSWRRTSVSLILLVALALPMQASESPVSVAVRPDIAFEGGTVRATVRTPRDARNRQLRIIVDASSFYGSSDVQLDGAQSPAIHQFTWSTLPGGTYRIDATLIRSNGEHSAATRCFAVLGHARESDEDGASARVAIAQAGVRAEGCGE